MMALPGAGADGLQQQAALLIDADNFSDAQAINAAWSQFKARAGRIHVFRAYGGVMHLQALASVWRTLGARTFPNLALEKNTTDAALIADAVALHFQQGVRIFAIASGDADFAPLAVRLREWGCEVWCFSMEGIIFQGVEAYYDRVVRFLPQPTAISVTVSVVQAVPIKPVHVSVPAASVLAAKPTPLPKAIKPPLPPALPDEVERILKAVPGLRDTPQMLNLIVPLLRQQAILGKATKSTVFFGRHAAYFTLSPTHQPTQLAYTPPRSMPPASAYKASAESAKPVQKLPERSAASTPATAAVLSWPVLIRRHVAPPLLAELHGLRSVLLQLAVRRVSTADVLLAVPEMLRGQPCSLSAVAGRLREKGLLRPYQSALRVLERHPGSFAVEMSCTPQAVIYLR
ncbi:MAG: NYN domain-containing protein [Burkholderiales bacterium]|nr:NYN domain-containing protein [Burkholderiales bacterium]